MDKNAKKTRDLEDLSATIKQIESDKKPKRKLYKTVLMAVFFPVTAIVFLFSKIFSARHLRLTTKTTIIFTAIFGFLLASYITIVLVLFNHYLYDTGGEGDGFYYTIVALSVGLGVAFIFIGSAVGAIVSSTMLSPIRKIITELATIDGENISKRLKPVDSQDELRELVLQLNTMLDSLEESLERQTNFVADASHELKTPLSVISGYSDLLLRWGKDDAAVLDESMTAIKRESVYMSKVLDKMLILARLGEHSLHIAPIDLSKLVLQIVDGYRVVHSDHSLSLYGDTDVTINSDKTLLTEAVRAIIDNAFKYTAAGGSVMVVVTELDGGAEIMVRDSGTGIESSDLPHIFDRFYRCDKTRGREKGSAGLGLTICKNIVELLGGSITAKSVKGEGSDFIIKLKN